MRKQATPAAQALARWLLAQEVGEGKPESVGTQVVLAVFERLRLHLGKLVGTNGFQALFARALTLAKAEVEWLENVQVKTNGSLEGFDEAAQQQPPTVAAAGGMVLLAQLLGLLMLFIGEDLTLRLVRDAWPDTLQKERNSDRKEPRNG